MILKTNCYVNSTIKKLCLQLELLTGMKLATDLSEEFEQIRFVSKLGYIVIDYQHSACFTLSYALSRDEWETIEDIILYCQWLMTGDKIEKILNKRSDLL